MTVSAMACIGAKARAARDPDETEESGDEGPTTAVSNGPNWIEKPVPLASPAEDTNGGGEKKSKQRPSSVVEAFGEVRALLWREEWMKAQIELLSQQRDQMARALEKVMNEKPPVLLAPPPTKRRKLEGFAGSGSTLPNGAAQGHSPRDPMQFDSPREAEAESSGNAWGCVRAVDWQQILGGRRRPLVQAVVPIDSLPPLQSAAQESRKRWRASAAHYQLNRHRFQAEESESGRQDGKRSGGLSGAAARHSPHSSSQPPHASSNRKTHVSQRHLDAHSPAPDSPASHKQGSVLKGGRSVVTPGGQKVVIKFSATKPSPQMASARGHGAAPGSPHHTPLSKHRNGGHKDGRLSEPNTPVLSAQKKHKSVLSLVTQSKTASPRMSPSAHPGTPRGADWGIDDYVYGGPRTHSKIEIIKAKEIETPKWHVIKRDEPKPKSGDKKEQGRQSRSLSVGSKYAKAKPSFQHGSNGNGADGSSDENTDDETFLSRHRPYEEQETKYRFPKQQQREQKHLEALKKEGGYINSVAAEQAYKSLWYRGDSSNSLDLDAASNSNGKTSKQHTHTPRGGTGSDADTQSPRPLDVEGQGSRKSTPLPAEGTPPCSSTAPLLDDPEGKNGKSSKNPPCERVMVTG